MQMCCHKTAVMLREMFFEVYLVERKNILFYIFYIFWGFLSACKYQLIHINVCIFQPFKHMMLWYNNSPIYSDVQICVKVCKLVNLEWCYIFDSKISVNKHNISQIKQLKLCTYIMTICKLH